MFSDKTFLYNGQEKSIKVFVKDSSVLQDFEITYQNNNVSDIGQHVVFANIQCINSDIEFNNNEKLTLTAKINIISPIFTSENNNAVVKLLNIDEPINFELIIKELDKNTQHINKFENVIDAYEIKLSSYETFTAAEISFSINETKMQEPISVYYIDNYGDFFKLNSTKDYNKMQISFTGDLPAIFVVVSDALYLNLWWLVGVLFFIIFFLIAFINFYNKQRLKKVYTLCPLWLLYIVMPPVQFFLIIIEVFVIISLCAYILVSLKNGFKQKK